MRVSRLFQSKLPSGDYAVTARTSVPLRRTAARIAALPTASAAVPLACGAVHADPHDMMVTHEFHAALPPPVRDHLVCRVVDEFIAVAQKHDIEALA
jgi:hypothetical protein